MEHRVLTATRLSWRLLSPLDSRVQPAPAARMSDVFNSSVVLLIIPCFGIDETSVFIYMARLRQQGFFHYLRMLLRAKPQGTPEVSRKAQWVYISLENGVGIEHATTCSSRW